MRSVNMASCPNQSRNMKWCNCSYDGCDKHAICCECLRYHLSMKQLPGCCFPPDAEKTYDRSFKHFVQIHKNLL